MGVAIMFGGLSLDMKFGAETVSTDWTDGKEMKTMTWRTGPNSIRVRNSVAETGIVEHQDLTFLPNGVQVRPIRAANDTTLKKNEKRFDSQLCWQSYKSLSFSD